MDNMRIVKDDEGNVIGSQEMLSDHDRTRENQEGVELKETLEARRNELEQNHRELLAKDDKNAITQEQITTIEKELNEIEEEIARIESITPDREAA